MTETVAHVNKIQYDSPIMLAVGGSRKEMHWRTRELLWSELVQKLQNPTRTPETAAEYKSLPKAKRDAIKDVGGFVGGVLKGGRRKGDAVAWRSLLTLDLDNIKENENPWPMVKLVLSCAAVCYSTHSHTESSPRLRIVIPLSRQVNADEYAAISRRVAADIGIDMCDDTTFEPHRLMYWPSVSCDAPYRFDFSDAPWLDADEQLSRYADWHDPSQWPQSSRKTDKIKRLISKQGDPLTKKGVVGAFCQVYSVEDAIAEFLSDVYVQCDNGRYTYRPGSTSGGLVIYDEGRFAYSHHGTDPAGGRLCNAFDLVRIHRYGTLDEDAEYGTPSAKLPSYSAMREFASDIPEVGAAMVAANFTDDIPNEDWLQLLDVDKNGIRATIDNIVIILQHDQNLAGRFSYDEFRERPIASGDLPWQDLNSRTSSVWQDSDDAGLRGYIEKNYKISSAVKVKDALDIAMLSARFHPVQEYLNSLKWDGVERIETLLTRYFDAEDCTYTRAVTKKALIGAVARIRKPGCKHDHMLVLIGPQGCGKSTFIAKLGGDWFSDSLYTLNGKDAYEQLQGHWIIELGEMAATRKAELEQIKQFVSKQTDSYRAAYARRTAEHPRQCAFFGTTNDNEFLHDSTGGRRFWPVVVKNTSIDLNAELTSDVVGQIWAEALELYNSGETWHLDKELEKEARLKQQEHTEVSSKAGLIIKFLGILLPEDWASRTLDERRLFYSDMTFDETAGTIPRTRVCALEIWTELFNGDIKAFTLQQAREINNILRMLDGWEARTKINCGPIYGPQRGFVKRP